MIHLKSSGQRSASYAKERMALLLLSEHLDCSPQMMSMLKHDLIKSVRKYIPVNEALVSLQIHRNPPVMEIRIPIRRNKEE